MKNNLIVMLTLILVSSYFISGCQKPDEKAAQVKDKAVETAAGYSNNAA